MGMWEQESGDGGARGLQTGTPLVRRVGARGLQFAAGGHAALNP